MKILVNIICILTISNLFAKFTPSSDSCLKAELYNLLAEKSQLTNSDSAIIYSKKAIKLANFCNDKNIKAKSFLNFGVVLDLKGKYPEALKNAFEALKIYRKQLNQAGEAKVLYLMGKISFHQSECSNDQSKQEYYIESINNYRLALEIEKKLKNSFGIIENQIEIGRVLLSLQKPDSALIILKKALIISEKNQKNNEFIHNIAKSSYNIALIYIDQDSLELAIHYLKKAALADSVLNNKEGLAVIRISEMYLRMNNYDISYQLAKQSLDTALKYGFALRVMQANEILHQALSRKENFKDAYFYLQNFNRLSDSLKNDNTVKELTQLKMQQAFDLEQERKDIANVARLDKQKLITSATIVILALLILFLIYGIKTYKQKKQDNLILAEQKNEISEKNEELNQTNEEILTQRDQIEDQKFKIEKAHHEVKASIIYAERIQKALLDNKEHWEAISQEYFILFKPRDVVSGDFYWAYSFQEHALDSSQEGNLCIWVAADCTGHGVPGAFMSMLGVSFLNEIIIDGGETNSGKILDKLRSKIIKTLEQKSSDDQRKDGMDLALCVWNKTTNILQYAGANNPLFIVKKDNTEPIEVKADKMPIGKHILDNNPFTTHEIQLEKGDTVYTFTDGFQDQFGGVEGKKYMVKRLKNYLSELKEIPISVQKEALNQEFKNWLEVGKTKQIDDVCIIGVRI